MIRMAHPPLLGVLIVCLGGALMACDKPQQARSPLPEVQQAPVLPEPASSPTQDEPVDDSSVTARIQHDLSRDSELGALLIAVQTQDGVVTLSGTVPDSASKTRAETLSRLAHGARAVQNLLEVAPQTPPVFPDGAEPAEPPSGNPS